MNLLTKILFRLSAILAITTSASTVYAGSNGSITFAPANVDPTAVPTLSSYMLIILSVLLFAVAFRVSKQKGADKFFVFILSASVLMAGTGGVKLVSDLKASSFFTISPPEGASFSITSGAPNVYENGSGVPQEVTEFTLPEFCQSYPDTVNTPIDCSLGLVLPDGSTCKVNCLNTTISDERLKYSINPLVKLATDIQLYSFKYNEGNGETFVGVMAQDLLKDERYKHAVKKMSNDFYAVDYHALDLKMISLEQWQKSPKSIFVR